MTPWVIGLCFMGDVMLLKRTVLLLLPLVLTAQSPSVPASPPGSMPQAMVVVPVAPDTLVLEEKSLLPLAALTSATLNQLSGDAIGDGQRGYNDASTNFQSSGNVNRHLNNLGDDMDMPNAMRLYGFTLQPGEKLSLKMKSEHASKMWMKFAAPPQQDAMTSAFMSANRMPKPMRASRLSIRNTTNAPYKLVVQVYGDAGNAYRIDIVREK